MQQAAKILMLSLFIAVSAFLIMTPDSTQALTEKEIMAATHIVNLEATPVWFKPGQPIDFVIKVRYNGGTQDGFDVGVFHEGRLVGWETNKRFNNGMNTFKIHDANFKGDLGPYIVKVRYKGRIFTEKRFITKSHCSFTIDPQAAPPR
ncbi:MAG: hypothetical protein LLF28_06250 [Nitrospiraceae bacterium]|nr:hypothetical protein [Nitrospiraceae bacterium]